jgi:CubicO group peptidase (beta-lactamase class C family)
MKVVIRQFLEIMNGVKTPEETFQNVFQFKPVREEGKFLYSDINYLVLSKAIEKITSKSFDVYLTESLLTPLTMTETSFNPIGNRNLNCRHRCAKTGWQGLGIVHDPTARHFDGISGNAGLFSTAFDLSKFASLFLNQGKFCGNQVLTESSVKEMTHKIKKSDRGLGFDITSPYSDRPRGDYFSKGISFGHTGFTGTSLWIDPSLNTFLIITSNAIGATDWRRAKRGYLNLIRTLANVVGKDALSRTDSI